MLASALLISYYLNSPSKKFLKELKTLPDVSTVTLGILLVFLQALNVFTLPSRK